MDITTDQPHDDCGWARCFCELKKITTPKNGIHSYLNPFYAMNDRVSSFSLKILKDPSQKLLRLLQQEMIAKS